MTEAELALLVATPSDELICVLKQDKVAVLSSDHLPAFDLCRLVMHVYWEFELNLCRSGLVLNNYLVANICVLCALAVIVPTPAEGLASTVASQ